MRDTPTEGGTSCYPGVGVRVRDPRRASVLRPQAGVQRGRLGRVVQGKLDFPPGGQPCGQPGERPGER